MSGGKHTRCANQTTSKIPIPGGSPQNQQSTSRRWQPNGIDANTDSCTRGPSMPPPPSQDNFADAAYQEGIGHSQNSSKRSVASNEHSQMVQPRVNGQATPGEIEHAERNLVAPSKTHTRRAHEQFEQQTREAPPQRGIPHYSDGKVAEKTVTVSYYVNDDPDDSEAKEDDIAEGMLRQ